MRAYKGFKKNEDGTLTCRDFTYEVGMTYKHDGDISLCKSGFHACHELHQCLHFYPNNGENVFCEVECGGNIIESDAGDGKLVCSEITILREVDMSGVAVFDNAWGFSEGYSRVEKDGKCNHIGTDGKLLSDKWWDGAWSFLDGYVRVKKDGKCNHMGTDGKMLSEEWWDDAWSFSKGYALVEKDGKEYNIDTEGRVSEC